MKIYNGYDAPTIHYAVLRVYTKNRPHLSTDRTAFKLTLVGNAAELIVAASTMSLHRHFMGAVLIDSHRLGSSGFGVCRWDESGNFSQARRGRKEG